MSRPVLSHKKSVLRKYKKAEVVKAFGKYFMFLNIEKSPFLITNTEKDAWQEAYYLKM